MCDDSARFATVQFMFRHRGRVRVALSEQDVAGGGVDRLFEEALAAGAEDFDEVTGADQGIEVEVRSVSTLDLLRISRFSIDYMWTKGAGKGNECCCSIRPFAGFVVQ